MRRFFFVVVGVVVESLIESVQPCPGDGPRNHCRGHGGGSHALRVGLRKGTPVDTNRGYFCIKEKLAKKKKKKKKKKKNWLEGHISKTQFNPPCFPHIPLTKPR
jgi:hypothetical protein